MVMAAGSVMNDPSSGVMVRTESHHAAAPPPMRPATLPTIISAKRMTGRVAEMAMMMTTKRGSVKLTSWPTYWTAWLKSKK